MKYYHSMLCVLVALVIFACGSKKADEGLADGSSSGTEEETSAKKPAVCIWKEISIRETPEEKGKYKTSIYLGEKLTALPDTASESANGKRVVYRKVELIDGAQGWVRQDFIAIDATPAAFLREATLYKRPDIMTTSGKNFNKMDFVAVTGNADGGWMEVIGKRMGDTWFSSGWVKSENLTMQQVDVAFSVFYVKAMDIEDETKRAEEIEKLLSNADLSTSVFQADFVTEEDYGDVEEEYIEESEEESEGGEEGGA